jgi:hypothetical protein
MQEDIPAPRAAAACLHDATQDFKPIRTHSRRSCATNRRRFGDGELRPRGGAPRARRRSVVSRVIDLGLAIIGTIHLTACGSSLLGSGAFTSAAPAIVPATAQCTSAGIAAQDLAGQCRSVPTAMGALEATAGPATAATATLLELAPLGSRTIQVSWPPLRSSTASYTIYFGRTAETANVLISDLPPGSGLFDPRAPAVTIDPTRELGLSPGDTACFRISGHDLDEATTNEIALTCTTV